MALIDTIQATVQGIDYLQATDKTIYATVLEADYQTRINGNNGSDTWQINDTIGTPIIIKVIINTDAPIYYPLTSLLDGRIYSIEVDDSGKPSWLSDSQVRSFNVWQKDHRAVFAKISDMLLSTEIARAQSVFENNMNGLHPLLNSFLADQASATPEVALTDIIPESSPAMTWGRWLLGILSWNAFETYLTTPINADGITPQMVLTSVEVK